MSRIGKKPIDVPAGVKVDLKGRVLSIAGPKGNMAWEHHSSVQVAIAGSKITVQPTDTTRQGRSLHGTTRQLIHNMVHGVTKGFERKLEIVGVGYNAKLQGSKLVLAVGFSHPITVEIPAGLKVQVPGPTMVVVTGADKQAVGQFVANVRHIRPPEPYKGKGIRYDGENIVRKAAKSFGAK
ncbi:MAG: 50S ribosomal protein L6 [Planctomycetota bacterium]